ncbi:acetylornithine aminotransferase [Entophlyctis luteolus]|nr:acetylornithine aminotransferase [Entophlyctis luteolus]
MRHMASDPSVAAVAASVPTEGSLLGLYPQPPFTFVRGERATLFDASGARFLDFNAGIAVNALGHNDPDVVAAIADQAAKIIHLSNLYRNEHAARCADLIVSGLVSLPATVESAERTAWWNGDANPGCKVFFCNSGTEANEGIHIGTPIVAKLAPAIKFARKQAHVTHPENPRSGILSFTNAFHGRSMGALSATPNKKYQTPFYPLVPGFHTSPYNDVAALEAVDWDSVCGVIVEPMQGEGGVFPATDEFLKAVRAKCDSVGAVLIFDEIQCGIGRSGKLFYHHNTPVLPDIVTLAKPLANGIPMGATVVRGAVARNIKPGDHGTTFGGNPLATRVACVVLAKIADPAFLEGVQRKSARLLARLHAIAKAYPRIVKDVRGKGLLVGMELQGGAQASRFVDLCVAHGNLLVISAGQNTVRMAPPLIISDEEIDEAAGVMEKVTAILNAE